MTQAMVTHDGADRVLEVLVSGNLSVLTPPERVDYFNRVCDSLSLNPLTKPFEFITLNGKLVLYATKAATDQLRELRNVSVTITSQQQVGDLYMVTVTATDATGRQDSDMGVVSTKNLAGENLANAMLKAITKAKRRVTLSICGLGMLDETEVADIPASAKRPPVQMPRSRADVDVTTGELLEQGVERPGTAEPVPPAGGAPPVEDASALKELSALLAAKALSMKDLEPQLGPVTRETARHAVTAWLIANQGKTVRDLVAAAIPESSPQEAPAQAALPT